MHPRPNRGTGLAPRDAISVVGDWAEDRFFDLSRREEHRRSVRAQFGVSDDEFVVLNTGMLREDKGQQHLIATAARLRDAGVKARYLLVGAAVRKPESREYERKLRNMTRSLGLEHLVIFAGYRSDDVRLTQGADVQVISSVAVEAQSRTVPQAFASMTQIVASRVGGVPELVTHAETGWLVPIGDSERYAAALTEAFAGGDALEAIRRRARALAERSLTLESKMAVTLDVYRRAIARPGRRTPS